MNSTAGNILSKFSNRISDQTGYFLQELHLLYQKHKNTMNIESSPKWTNEYPLESSKNEECEYVHDLTYKFLNLTDRAKKVSQSNIQIHITSSIPNENSWSKLQCNLCSTIYLNHMLISRIEGFEISPYECAVRVLELFEPPIVKTDVLWCCGRWMQVEV